jgi:hypothetical protein
MRFKVLAFAASLLLITNSSVAVPQAPTTTTSSTQAATLLGQSAQSLTGSIAVNDVTLTGTVEWIAGSDDETGTAVYKAVSGAHRMDLSFRNGTRSEIASAAGGVPTGTWIGLDGTSHAVADHNLMSDAGWFPSFTFESLVASSNTVLSYVGQEVRNGSTVIHISSSQVFPGFPGNLATLSQHLTQVDIYLDPSTFLPVSYVYNSHPDNDALLDIPTEIRYSSYQAFNGVQIPLHIQKYINNTLVLDLHFQNASLNTGMTAVQIVGQ